MQAGQLSNKSIQRRFRRQGFTKFSSQFEFCLKPCLVTKRHKTHKCLSAGSEELFLEKANVLVTGGAGFIGSHLVDGLVEKGHRVRVLDMLVSQVHGENAEPKYVNPAAEFVRGDVCDRAAVDAALEGIDVVFHEAAEVGVGQSMYEIERYVRANDLGTAVLLEAILERRPQIKKLVVASSMSIYGEGAYTCANCGSVAPQLRPPAQLLERRWEVECPKCGQELQPSPTTEEKPLFPTSVYAVTKQDQEQFC